MSAPCRPDLYALAHKALRALMAEMVTAVGRMDAEDDADVRATFGEVEAGLALCALHLRLEEDIVHPALEALRPGTTARAGLEHVEHEEEFAALRAALANFLAAPREERRALAHRLHLDFARWMAGNFLHMAHEEAQHNPVLWKGCDDEQLQALHERILAGAPPAAKAAFQRWMLPAASHPERLALLAGLRAGAPRETYEGALATARQGLRAGDWQKLFAALEARPAIAA